MQQFYEYCCPRRSDQGVDYEADNIEKQSYSQQCDVAKCWYGPTTQEYKAELRDALNGNHDPQETLCST